MPLGALLLPMSERSKKGTKQVAMMQKHSAPPTSLTWQCSAFIIKVQQIL
jgi:hypothetical protein